MRNKPTGLLLLAALALAVAGCAGSGTTVANGDKPQANRSITGDMGGGGGGGGGGY